MLCDDNIKCYVMATINYAISIGAPLMRENSMHESKASSKRRLWIKGYLWNIGVQAADRLDVFKPTG
jgi:hypothetical protein